MLTSSQNPNHRLEYHVEDSPQPFWPLDVEPDSLALPFVLRNSDHITLISIVHSQGGEWPHSVAPMWLLQQSHVTNLHGHQYKFNQSLPPICGIFPSSISFPAQCAPGLSTLPPQILLRTH